MNEGRPYIIGEAGSCHEESLEKAQALVRVAAEARCQAVKFQYWSHPARMQLRRNVTEVTAYTKGSVHGDWFGPLMDLAHEQKIDFICSVYLPEDVDFVARRVDALKIASFESLDRELVAKVRETGKPFFISTGMQREGELSGIGKNCVVMHCVSAYPCPLAQANLRAIWPHQGYSDHTAFIGTGGLAVAAGADYVEVHFRLHETSQSCPDYIVALSPEQLGQYVWYARVAYILRGSGRKEPQECEKDMMKHQVRSS